MNAEMLLGSIPNDWIQTTLGEACRQSGGDVQTGPFGSQLHAADYVPDGIPSIMPQNIADNRVIEDGIARISPTDAARLARYLVREGDIVYSRRGDVERRALIRRNEDGWLCGTGCLRVRFGNGHVDPRYASYYLGHPSIRQWIIRHAQGATMPNLNTSILSALPFVVPPPNVQSEIADFLGALDDKIELNRRTNETLEDIARAIFKSWFVDFDCVRAKTNGEPEESIRARLGLTPELYALFPDNFRNEIPEGWSAGTLASYATLNSESWTQRDAPNEIRYVDLANTKWGSIETPRQILFKDAPSRAQRVLRRGDTIVGTVRPGNGSFALVTEDGLTGSTGFAALRPTRAEFDELVYLAATQRSNIDRLSHLADGGAYPAVRPDVILSTGCVLCNVSLIEGFAKIVGPLFKRKLTNERESRSLIVLRDALLPRLLSGDLRIPPAVNV